MKKCPECGNPSYDGAPVCGNCGYKFPMKKRVAPKKEANIFDNSKKAKKEPKTLHKKTEKAETQSTLEIIKENKILIGIIVGVTIIAICGIVLSGSHNKSINVTGSSNALEYSAYGVSFIYPENWKSISLSDSEHPNAIFFDAGNNTVVEFYNITSGYNSLKEINQGRITNAQNDGDYVNSVETLTIDDRNASDLIIEKSDGDYIRYISTFSDGKLYVFKITGSSINDVNADNINTMINSLTIE